MKNTHKYDDIIHLPHHVSTTHPQMSLLDRAAQFSAFAALSGHSAAIHETEKLVEKRVEEELQPDRYEELKEEGDNDYAGI